MTAAVQERRGSYIERPSPSSLADVVELILDKGLVIDAYVRVSLVGIEILTIDARIVVASVDTYLRFAEATNRLDLYQHGGKGLDEMTKSLAEGGAEGKTKGALSGVKDKAQELFQGATGGSDEDDDENGDEDDEPEKQERPRRSTKQRSSAQRRRRRDDEDR